MLYVSSFAGVLRTCRGHPSAYRPVGPSTEGEGILLLWNRNVKRFYANLVSRKPTPILAFRGIEGEQLFPCELPLEDGLASGATPKVVLPRLILLAVE